MFNIPERLMRMSPRDMQDPAAKVVSFVGGGNAGQATIAAVYQVPIDKWLCIHDWFLNGLGGGTQNCTITQVQIRDAANLQILYTIYQVQSFVAGERMLRFGQQEIWVPPTYNVNFIQVFSAAVSANYLLANFQGILIPKSMLENASI